MHEVTMSSAVNNFVTVKYTGTTLPGSHSVTATVIRLYGHDIGDKLLILQLHCI